MSIISNDGTPVNRWNYMSAYAIAVKHGYNGSEEEWLTLIYGNADFARAKAEEAAASAAAAALSEEHAYDSENQAFDSAAAASASEDACRDYAESIGDETAGIVADWLDEHVDPETGYVIDDSLTIEGAAADAKAVGDGVAALETLTKNMLTAYPLATPDPAAQLIVRNAAKDVPPAAFRLAWTFGQEGEGDPAPDNVRDFTGSQTGVSFLYAPIVITEQPANFEGSDGTTAEFHIAAFGDGLTYQWQYKSSGGSWGNINSSAWSGTTTDTASVEITSSRRANQYRCVVTDAQGHTALSQPVLIYLPDETPSPITPDYTPTTQQSCEFDFDGKAVYAGYVAPLGHGKWRLYITHDYAVVDTDTGKMKRFCDGEEKSFGKGSTAYVYLDLGPANVAKSGTGVSNMLKSTTAVGGSLADGVCQVYHSSGVDRMRLRCDSIGSTASAWNAWIENDEAPGAGFVLMWELSNPVTVDLDEDDLVLSEGTSAFVATGALVDMTYCVDQTWEESTKLDKESRDALDWAKIYGDGGDDEDESDDDDEEEKDTGWETGYYNSSGATGSSSDSLRTKRGRSYVAGNGDAEIVFTVPAGKHAAIVEYDANGKNGVRYGSPSSGSNKISIVPTAGKLYRFCFGDFDGQAATYNNSTYLANVTAVVRRSVPVWMDKTEQRVGNLEELVDAGLPDYYFTDDWLDKAALRISKVQNSISANQDAFWFISDTHHQYSAGHSAAMLKYLTRKTGITKMIYAGDAGGRYGSTADARYTRLEMSAAEWARFSDAVGGEFYGVLGNHEWISTSTIGTAGVMGAYLNRYKTRVTSFDAATGNYYVDNPANKIRYIFVQDRYAAYPVSGSIMWLNDVLLSIGAGWSVAMFMHHVFVPAAACYAEYDGVIVPSDKKTIDGEEVIEEDWNHPPVRDLSKMLVARRDKQSLDLTGTYGAGYVFDYGNCADCDIIGLFGGHIHHSFLWDGETMPPQDENWPEGAKVKNIGDVLGLRVFRASTDCLHAASVAVDGAPWFWKNGIVGGEKVVREGGTVLEQCFYAVQIDLDAKKFYITAVGGDRNIPGQNFDWQMSYDWEG